MSNTLDCCANDHKSRVANLAAALGAGWHAEHQHETATLLTSAAGYAVFVRTQYADGRIVVSAVLPRDPRSAGYIPWHDARHGGPEPRVSYAGDRLDSPEGARKVAADMQRRVISPLEAAWPVIQADAKAIHAHIAATLATAERLAQVVGSTLSEAARRGCLHGDSAHIHFPGGLIGVYGERVTFERLSSVSPEVALQVIALLTGKGA